MLMGCMFLLCGNSAAASPTNTLDITLELGQIKQSLLGIQDDIEPFAVRQNYLYLTLDDDLPVVSAVLRTDLSEETPTAHIFPSPQNGLFVDRLTRIPIGKDRLATGPCRVEMILRRDEGEESRSIPCSIPEVADGENLEVRVASRWIRGTSAKIKAWPPLQNANPSGRLTEPDASTVKQFTNAVTGLARALDEAIGPREKSRPTEPGTRVDDLAPDLRYVMQRCGGDNGQAMGRLYRYRQAYDAHLPTGYWLGYGRCSLKEGIYAEAAYAHARILDLNPASDAAWEMTWRMADFLYRGGDAAAALLLLDQNVNDAPSEMQSSWRDLKSRALLASGRTTEAVEVLARGRHLAVAGTLLETHEADSLHEAMRMNYAYALSADGQVDAAHAVLNRVGTLPARTITAQTLRARANAKLGWHFLSEGYGETAVRVLHRIPLEGLYSDRALLGMGWAMLAPSGEAQPLIRAPGFTRSETDPPATAVAALLRMGEIDCNQYLEVTASMDCNAEYRFKQDEFSDDDEQQLRRALVYWNELVGRDEPSAARLEAKLAMAEALTQLGDKQQGQRFYSEASSDAQQSLSRLDTWVSAIEAALESNSETFEAAASPANAELKWWLNSEAPQQILSALNDIDRINKQLRLLMDSPLRLTAYAPKLGVLRQRLVVLQKTARTTLRYLAQQHTQQLASDYKLYAANAGLGEIRVAESRR